MAITQKKQIWFWGTSLINPPPLRVQYMAASQGVIIPSSPVELNTSGLIELSDTDDTQIYGFLCGVVERSTTWPLTAALSTSAAVRCSIARVGDLYAVYAENNASDSAIAQANVGTAYGMVVSATSGMVGYASMDLNEASSTMFRVEDCAFNVSADYASTDNPGVAIVKITGTLQG